MSDEQGFSFPTLRPEATIATAQHGLTCFSRAWTQVVHGLMSANMAHVELARAIYADAPTAWQQASPPHDVHEAAQRNLEVAKLRFDTAVSGYRRINDELAATFFAVASSLVDGLGAAPASAKAAAAKPVAVTKRAA
jgi:hypothetical protein